MDGAMDKLNDAYDCLEVLMRVHGHLWEAYKTVGCPDDDFGMTLLGRIELCIDKVVEEMHAELDRAGEAIGAMMDEQSERTAAELRKAFEEVKECN